MFWNPIAHLNSQKLLTEQPDASRITHLPLCKVCFPFAISLTDFISTLTNMYSQPTACNNVKKKFKKKLLQQCPLLVEKHANPKLNALDSTAD